MVLLVADRESEQYVFYYVPLLPKAIGGLSSNLEKLAQALPNHIQNDIFPLTIDGWCLGEHSLERILIETKECFWFVERGNDDRAFQLTSVGFFDFIESISHWIVRTHGQSIKMKEYADGSV